MNQLVTPLLAWLHSFQYPTLLVQLWVGFLAVALVALLLRRRRRAPAATRCDRARQLAARGATPLEIARATGLSRDAAGLLLHRGAAAGERMILPLPARISGPQRAFPHVALRRRSA